MTEAIDKLILEAPSDEERAEQDTRERDEYRATLGNAIKSAEWDFDTQGSEELREAFLEVRRWVYETTLCHAFGETDPYWLTLCGPSERGKTHLAHRACSLLKRVSAIPVPQSGCHPLINPLRVAFSSCVNLVEQQKKRRGFVRGINENFAVCVDDLGEESSRAGWDRDIVYQLLAERAEKGTIPPRATIITTNMTVQEIAEIYEPRLASRLRRGQNRIVTITEDTKAFHDVNA